MSRRKEANRAEAIVKAIGAIIMLLLLFSMVHGTPGWLPGKNPGDPIAGLLTTLKFFVGLFVVITVVGLLVWIIVLKGPRKRASNPGANQFSSRPGPNSSALSCADCGTGITSGIANYCQNRRQIFNGKSLRMPCQTHYRANEARK